MKTFENRLAWLAGIVDGEGYMTVTIQNSDSNWHTRKDGSRGRRVIFILAVKNTDENMILEVRDIARELGIEGTMSAYKRKNPKWKPVWGIAFASIKRAEPLIRAILPYLVTKRARAEVILETIAYRKKKFTNRPDDDQWLVARLNELRPDWKKE